MEKNWAGNVTYRATEIHHPATLVDLRSTVANAARIRALGTKHAFNELADTGGELVSLARMPREVEVDSDGAQVKVSAGLRYAEFSEDVDAKGFALPNLASLPHISVAGATATATHGSGSGNGSLSTSVAGLEIVTADGSLHMITRGDSEFDGAVVNLGALGVVASLTLDLVPAFEIRQYVHEGLPLGADILKVLDGAYSVSLFTDWSSDTINQVWVKQRTQDAEFVPDGTIPADGPRHPVPGMATENCTRQLGIPGRSFERLPHFRPEFTPSAGEELQTEFMVARHDAVAALQAVNEIRAHIHPVLQISEIRAIKADELWLSPHYRRDTVSIHFTWIADAAAVMPVVSMVGARLAEFDARPHWAKIFDIAPEVLQSRYERLQDFEDLAVELDPAGKFRNEFVSELFS
ncbi:FAD-binding protein [Kibdelosporangium philippinense]|uniref:FAD-binding protein n=1 Tax=Kibdelosporangium philippinense TaxID=211113 RepID=A0ABS8ZUH5_9PSEU|nr:FAD-binding protein [Kibdelosporangium philippinense]MCE7011257.1 FAD-binding protein [Kibdelosporangium philippinense]